MGMKIAICDDDKYFLEKLYQTLTTCKNAISCAEYHTFSCGVDLVANYKKRKQFDVVFLDIEMPGLSGLETGQKIREIDSDVMIVFITSHHDFMSDSFKIETFDYLTKPLDEVAANDTLGRVFKKYQEHRYIVTLKVRGAIHKLDVSDIVYIESYRKVLTFYTENEAYEMPGKLNDYEIKLVPYGFLKCHQGYLINMKYIESIENNRITTITGVTLDMSARKKRMCLKAFNEYTMRHRI